MPAYARGSKAWGMCMRCGLRYLLKEMVFDGYFPNLVVCKECYDAPQPQEKLAIVTDPEALWFPAPDSTNIYPPFLTVEQSGLDVVLSWTSIGQNPATPGNSGGGAYNSLSYFVWRAPVTNNAVGTFVQIATLPTEPDEFGALSVETLTFTDTPGTGTWAYYVQGNDILETAEFE